MPLFLANGTLPDIDADGRFPMHSLGRLRESLAYLGRLTPQVNSQLTLMLAQRKPATEIINAFSLQEAMTPEPARYAYVMAKLPLSLAKVVLSFPVDKQDLKPDLEDVNRGDDGREHEPHITVKYGLLNDDLNAVVRQIDELLPFIVYPEPTTDIFQHTHQDVLITRVDKGPILNYSLQAVHAKLNELPHADTHAEYIPHVTIAYLQPGSGKKYVGKTIELKPFEVRTLTYVSPEGKRSELWV